MTDQLTTSSPRLDRSRLPRRRLVALAAGVLATLAGSPLTGQARRGRKGKGNRKGKRSTKTVTKTFANPAALEFPQLSGPATRYPSEIRVSGFKRGKVKEVQVILRNLRHDFPQDLDLMLQAPDGRRAVIMSDVGGLTRVNGITLTLKDKTQNALSTAPLSSGAFRPANNALGNPDTFPSSDGTSGNVALSTFTGSNPNGIWRLFAVDDEIWFDEGAPGAIQDGWELRIKAKVRK